MKQKYTLLPGVYSPVKEKEGKAIFTLLALSVGYFTLQAIIHFYGA